VALATGIHIPNTLRVVHGLPLHRTLLKHLGRHIFVHPAQASISLDVLWVVATLVLWFLTYGNLFSVILKFLLLTVVTLFAVATHIDINWGLVASVMPIVLLLLCGVAFLCVHRLRAQNVERRKAVLELMGITENRVIPGTKDTPPSKSRRSVVVGFWHPYW
jgi:alpha-1,2-mannosyltransferase